jgi:RHS repeat-associated protein
MTFRRTPFSSSLKYGCLGLAMAASLFTSGSVGRAQTQDYTYLFCSNDFAQPLLAFDLPLHPQSLYVNLAILTNAYSTVQSHTVFVLNAASQPIGSVNFNVYPQGNVTPNLGVTIIPAGQSPGTQQQCQSTIINKYQIVGDNFSALGAWPNSGNWPVPAVVNLFQFNLDSLTELQPPDENCRLIYVASDYHYTKWAWISFLGYQDPYLPGASTPNPNTKTITFDLRGAPPGKVPRPPDPQQKFTDCPCQTCHMARAYLDRFQAGIAIADTPISYSPSVGMNMAFTVKYHQRQNNQPSTFMYSNLGQQWNANWISYITGGPTNGQSDAIYNAPDGSQYTYGGYERTVAQGQGAIEINQGDFQANEGWTHATLHYRQGPERYERWLPDGTVETYAQPAGVAGNRSFFLTLVKDPQGFVTTLHYDSNAAANGQAVLTSVVDPIGNQLTFSYDTANPLLIAKVTRSQDQRSATFTYTNGQLTSITDPIGITSSFQYAPGTFFISSMTTPYGLTTFNSVDGPGFLEADITNPLHENERVEYQEDLDPSLFSVANGWSIPSISGTSVINTANLNLGNSYYWSRRAMSDFGNVANDTSSAFYGEAEVTHWAQSGIGTIPVPLATKKPLEGWVCFNYPGQNPAPNDYVLTNNSSASVSPSLTARIVETSTGTTTQTYQATYNSNGMITQSIDPKGRTTKYAYALNQIDLTQVSQTDGSGQDILSKMTYDPTNLYDQHEPVTIVDASGQTTTLTYDPTTGHLHSRTDALGHTVTWGYDSNGYVNSVSGSITDAMTYTNNGIGLVTSSVDSEGYTLNMSYDYLDRLATVTYMDGTTDLTSYNKLDVASTTDRQGRITTNQYDAIRELLQTTDPLGRTTQYSWCTCGGLSQLTDANGNITEWDLDTEGRVTGKTYGYTGGHNSSTLYYTYETNSGRLSSMTDARSNKAAYVYNTDNTLASTTYTPTASPDPSVSFTYDSVYNRVTSMVDSTGTTTYSYNAITGSLTTGAGRLSSVSVPIASSTAGVTYSYDALGRVNNRSIDTGNSVSTTFDALGRVTGVTNALTPTGSFTYSYVDATSRLSSVACPSGTGLSTNYSYFGSGDYQDFERLQTIQNMSGSTQLSRFDYTYKPVGTITTWAQQTSSATGTYTMSYDNADQLVDAEQTLTGTTVSSNKYNYDPAGNRLSQITLTGTTVGAFNNLNQLMGLTGSLTTTGTVAGYTSSSVTNVTVADVTGHPVSASITGGTNFSATVAMPPGTNIFSVVATPTGTTIPVTTQKVKITLSGTLPIALSYDLNGNTTTDENGNTYTWDALNRLTKISYAGGGGYYSTFAYDGLSRRTQIVDVLSTGTTTKNYLWVGSEIAEERDGSNNVTKRFFPQGEQQTVSGTTTPYYYTRDHLGSVREMCSSTGTITSRMAYDLMGRVTIVSGTNLPFYQYAGLVKHATSGLDMATNRIYENGRWLSRDPIGESGGLNLYDYVLNDPIDGFDPEGLVVNKRTWSDWWNGGGLHFEVEKCEIFIFYGHNSASHPVQINTPNECSAAGAVTCFPGRTNPFITKPLPGLQSHDQLTVFNLSGAIAQNIEDQDNAAGFSIDGDKLLAAMRQDAKDQAQKLLKRNGGCCDEVKITEYRNGLGPPASPPIIVK